MKRKLAAFENEFNSGAKDPNRQLPNTREILDVTKE